MFLPMHHPTESGETLGERLDARGVSRREFLDFCGKLAIVLGLGELAGPRVAQALQAVRRPSVIWIQLQECTGCVESVLRTVEPTIGNLVLEEPEPGEPQLTGAGMLAGTPAYMAPELWHAAPADERSDIYALGVTFYFVLTGALPTPAWVTGEIPVEGPPSGAVGIPDSLRAVIRRCLAKRPEDRYQSAHQLRRALEDTLPSLPAPDQKGLG